MSIISNTSVVSRKTIKVMPIQLKIIELTLKFYVLRVPPRHDCMHALQFIDSDSLYYTKFLFCIVIDFSLCVLIY